MGVCNRQPLAKSKGVHREAESEGSLRQNPGDTEEGTPQGGNIAPLLSNIILNELDKELTKRGLKFCRYADDCNIYVKSRKAAERVLENIQQPDSRQSLNQ